MSERPPNLADAEALSQRLTSLYLQSVSEPPGFVVGRIDQMTELVHAAREGMASKHPQTAAFYEAENRRAIFLRAELQKLHFSLAPYDIVIRNITDDGLPIEGTRGDQGSWNRFRRGRRTGALTEVLL